MNLRFCDFSERELLLTLQTPNPDTNNRLNLLSLKSLRPVNLLWLPSLPRLFAVYLITNHSYGCSGYLCCVQRQICCWSNSSQRAQYTQRIGGASAALQIAANTFCAKGRRAERIKNQRRKRGNTVIVRKLCCLRKKRHKLTIKYIKRYTSNMSRPPGRKQENHKIVRHFCNV